MNIGQVFKDLDEYIAYFKKAKDGALPPNIRLNAEQARLLKKWAEERKGIYQDTVVLNDKGVITSYKGIQVAS